MRQAVTISFNPQLKKEVDKFVKEEGLSRSALIMQAVQDYIYFRKLKKLRDKMILKNPNKKSYTDEEIFNIVS